MIRIKQNEQQQKKKEKTIQSEIKTGSCFVVIIVANGVSFISKLHPHDRHALLYSHTRDSRRVK